MARQLHLIPQGNGSDDLWRLDPETRTVGRLGLAQARAALRKARGTTPPEPTPLVPHSTSTRGRRAA